MAFDGLNAPEVIMKWACIEAAAIVLFVCDGSALAQTDNVESPIKATQRALAEMNDAFIMGHPDLWFEYVGMKEYVAGGYKQAMRYFMKSAWYSDKPSQLSIGLMYLNGQGVNKDLVAAYAWTALSAERHYPDFEATRDQIWRQLEPEQRHQGLVLEQSLIAEYGDQIAKPREIRAMRIGWMNIFTYTHVIGNGANSSVVPITGDAARCESDNTPRGCMNVYAKWLWDPKQYFMVRDAAWNSAVTAGPTPYARSAPEVDQLMIDGVSII
jgi:hypothetical protein